MNKNVYLIFLMVIGFACNNKPAQTNESLIPELPDSTNYVVNSEHKKNGLTIYPLEASPIYKDARIVLQKPAAGSQHPVDQEIDFEFRMLGESYALGEATSDESEKGLVSSENGQYIQLLFQDGTTAAFHEKSFTKSFSKGKYVTLACLSRSYHETVKSASTFQLFQFTVGDVKANPTNLAGPFLFYNRPSGTYVGEDAKKVLLDFYIMNTNLSMEGNKVLVTVNDKTKFVIAKWRPYILEGLPMGENKIKIELLDKNGQLLGVGNNRIEKTFTLKETAELVQ